jgi:hypothetical protein
LAVELIFSNIKVSKGLKKEKHTDIGVGQAKGRKYRTD